MDQPAVDAFIYWVARFFLCGFAVGLIVRFLVGRDV